jgi:diguanylate cyclase (GGDEF)-like protein/putative nucleotidyltransferase with HDIG domain
MSSFVRKLIDTWYRIATPTQDAIQTTKDKERVRKIRLLSALQFFTMAYTALGCAEWIALHEIQNLFAATFLFLTALVSLVDNKLGNFTRSTITYLTGYMIFMIYGALPNLANFPHLHGNNYLWDWSELVLIPIIASFFLPDWITFLAALIDVGLVIALFYYQLSTGVFALKMSDDEINDFISNTLIVLFILATIAFLNSFSLKKAIEIADRSEEIADINSELETIFNTVQDMLLVNNADRVIIRANAACHQFFENRQFIGAPIDEFLSILSPGPMNAATSPDSEGDSVLLNKILAPPTSFHINLSGAKQAVVEITMVPLSEKKRELGALTIIHDISEEYVNKQYLAILQQIISSCANVMDEMSVAKTSLDILATGFGISYGIMLTRDPEQQEYAQVIGTWSSQDSQTHKQFMEHIQDIISLNLITPQSALIPLQILATKETIIDRPFCSIEGEAVCKHAIYIPLLLKEDAIGVLGLEWNSDTSTLLGIPTADLLAPFAYEIAKSLHRSRLFEEARRLAFIDPLTGIYNHRAIQDMLLQELTTGGSQGTPVSVIMLDIDHFHKINDLYGHDAGDQALRTIAKLIRSKLRKIDMVGRYGGEEFIMILPRIDFEETGNIAEEIRCIIEQHPFLIFTENATEMPLTVSIGYATFPQHASVPASILKAVDLALYSAKRAGRNQCVGYSLELIARQPVAMLPATSNKQEITLPRGADLATIQSFIIAIDLRDGYTAAHSEGVAKYAAAIATTLHLSQEQIELLQLGGWIHDIGKIGVPDHILRKPGKLTAEEWEIMKSHTTMGAGILQPVEQLHPLIAFVRSHHERLDGSGYPDGLCGDEIPLLVRILSVADVYDAYTAERPYHPGRTTEDGISFLHQEGRAERLDTTLIEALERSLALETEKHSQRQLRQEAA